MIDISRRDFLNGIALIGISSFVNSMESFAGDKKFYYYPPSKTGLRGAHSGSFEAAHSAAWGGNNNFGSITKVSEYYDLVIVGAGISGLTSALYYLEYVNKNAKILILDNHDDFGGHAKRNEFKIDGVDYLTYGGTQSFDSPSNYSQQSRKLLSNLGISLKKLSDSYDINFFKKHKMTSGIYYDADDFGRAALIKSGLPTTNTLRSDIRGWVPGLETPPSFLSSLSKAPLSLEQKRILEKVGNPGKSAKDFFDTSNPDNQFEKKSYLDFLKSVYGINDK